MSFEDSKENKREANRSGDTTTEKKNPYEYACLTARKKKEVDMSVLVMMWKVNNYNIESR